MAERFHAEELAYWMRQAEERGRDVEAARARRESPHLVTGAELRLKEAKDRLELLKGSDPSPPSP